MSDALLNKAEELLPEHRKRLYPPTETLSMFLAQAMNVDRSCQNIVNQAIFHRLAGGLNVNSIVYKTNEFSSRKKYCSLTQN
jgi:hypothetical protein